jgi:hypothetical protein
MDEAVMLRACGASSTPGRLSESGRLRLLDHPLSRMMTVIPSAHTPGPPTIYPLSSVAISAADHMMNIMQEII